jgi:hypothetical protein
MATVGGASDRSILAKYSNALRAVGTHPEALLSLPAVLTERGRSNWDQREPWWNHRAIRAVERELPPHGHVFEWGSGGSTLWFADRGYRITAVESEQEWADRVHDACPAADVRHIPGRTTGSMRSEPLFRDHGSHYFDDYVHAIDQEPDDSIEVILIDGLCRSECAAASVRKVAPGGMVILDDSNYEFLAAAFTPFSGWETRRVRGFKRIGLPIFETTVFRAPA